ncbi:MAG: hypothetical protein ACFFD4_37235 [Candidatus Odinarchaeota archaeon]
MVNKNAQKVPSNLDYLETIRGDLFVVVGEQHPLDRIFAYLKYIPHGPVAEPNKEWHRKGIRYKRVLPYYHYSFIRENLSSYTDFLFDCPVNDITMTAVPVNMIKNHYKPRERIEKLYQQSGWEKDRDSRGVDKLEKKMLDLIKVLADTSNIHLQAFGVTGSILPGIHNPIFSDIDLTVYGESNAVALRRILVEILKNPRKGIFPLSKGILEDSCRKQAKLYRITEKQAMYILKRRWNHQIFRGTRFSIHPILPRVNNYGNILYRNEGDIQLTGTVIDAREGLFYPPSWELEINSSSLAVLSRGEKITLTSFEGFYQDVFNEGDKIKVYGKLEKKMKPSGDLFGYRAVVGGSDNSKVQFLELTTPECFSERDTSE